PRVALGHVRRDIGGGERFDHRGYRNGWVGEETLSPDHARCHAAPGAARDARRALDVPCAMQWIASREAIVASHREGRDHTIAHPIVQWFLCGNSWRIARR